VSRNYLCEENPWDFSKIKLQEGWTAKGLAKKAWSLSPHGDVRKAIRYHKVGVSAGNKAALHKATLGGFNAALNHPEATQAMKAGYANLARSGATHAAVQGKAKARMIFHSKSAAKKLALIGVGITAAGLARKAYKARKVQVNMKPSYREYDAYPEHNNAVVPAHKTNRPYYDDNSGGRTVARYAEGVLGILHKNRLLEDRLGNLGLF